MSGRPSETSAICHEMKHLLVGRVCWFLRRGRRRQAPASRVLPPFCRSAYWRRRKDAGWRGSAAAPYCLSGRFPEPGFLWRRWDRPNGDHHGAWSWRRFARLMCNLAETSWSCRSAGGPEGPMCLCAKVFLFLISLLFCIHLKTISFILYIFFLDALSHFYKSVCLSVGLSVHWSVRHIRVEIMYMCHFWPKLRLVRFWNRKVWPFGLFKVEKV